MLAAWVLADTAVLGHLWLARPDLGPQVSPALSLWLVAHYGSTNGEELRELETLLALGSAFIVVLTFTLSGLLVFRLYADRPAP